jgi:hypothetical protein
MTICTFLLVFGMWKAHRKFVRTVQLHLLFSLFLILRYLYILSSIGVITIVISKIINRILTFRVQINVLFSFC